MNLNTEMKEVDRDKEWGLLIVRILSITCTYQSKMFQLNYESVVCIVCNLKYVYLQNRSSCHYEFELLSE